MSKSDNKCSSWLIFTAGKDILQLENICAVLIA